MGSDYYAIDFNGTYNANCQNIGSDDGNEIKAINHGTVLSIGEDPTTGYGYNVVIDHGSGITSRYAHLKYNPKQSPSILVNEEIYRGQVIGYNGNTGNSSGPHLHFVLYENGSSIRPTKMDGSSLCDDCGGTLVFSRNAVARLGVLDVSNDLFAKEGPLNAGWSEMLWDNASDSGLSGSRSSVIENGNLRLKEGALNTGWTLQTTDVSKAHISGTRIAVRKTNGDVYAKEGTIDASWGNLQTTNASQVLTTPTRIGVVLSNGDFYAKHGLNDAWMFVAPNVTYASMSGNRIAIVQSGGNVVAKEGEINATWGNTQTTNSSTVELGDDRLCVIKVGGATECKEGTLNASWVLMYNNASKVRVTRHRVAIKAEDDGYLKAIEGPLTGNSGWQNLSSGSDIELN